MIAQVENAILAELAAAGGPSGLGYSFAVLESSPDDWEALLADRAKTARTPAAWVGFLGWDRTVTENGGLIHCENARFLLVVMARNLRNGADARQASATGVDGAPGSYQLLQDVTVRLSLFEDDDIAMSPMRVGKSWQITRSPALRSNGFSAFAVELHCDLWLTPREGGNPAPFTRFHADWDVQPFGQGRDGTPIGPIPDPLNADAADDVMLPGAPA